MKGKDLIKLLEKDGWEVKRTRGSHNTLKKNGKSVTVPVHNTDLGKGILDTILKQTGLKK
ncbi:MAG: type II toxin-antitoxin system HicA family toxin [Oscillospiraceae bacterium]|nr:type II toxin-antitoxin system HicA family toxin [Oscillospiraceae bacterium]